MKLIIGGAYQGKHAFAKEKFGFSEEQFFLCTDTAIDFSRPVSTDWRSMFLPAFRKVSILWKS